MMPRPLLSETIGVSYRKIPILAIGREIYCDTSLIIEALEHYFPTSSGYNTIYPPVKWSGSWDYRPLARGFASFWTDKPLFRTTTGLIPHTVWDSAFGTDRAQLIGHNLDTRKLKAKVPQNLGALDLHLSLLEPTFAAGADGTAERHANWAFPTETPSLADLSLWYQIKWGVDIAAGKGIYNLTGGGTSDTDTDVAASVWNRDRYPGLWRWFHDFEKYIDGLPDLEVVVREGDGRWKAELKDVDVFALEDLLVPASAAPHGSLDGQRGLKPGSLVSIVPDDTGRDNPTVGRVVAIGVEEVVIEPEKEGEMRVRVHFPRLGFVVKVVNERAKL
ncbi:hypothetical protein SLS59_009722 [Nothophoma quercina]|uniref:DUF7962 domain-containing protein n=1 Tax=Nothophoma quercina TaxID=749835 RepID=A0ABR3QK08_9PLEO